jgi:hypothetical protein
MITNQLSWSGPFGLVVTLTGYGAGGPGSSLAMGTCGVTLSFLLHQYTPPNFVAGGIIMALIVLKTNFFEATDRMIKTGTFHEKDTVFLWEFQNCMWQI